MRWLGKMVMSSAGSSTQAVISGNGADRMQLVISGIRAIFQTGDLLGQSSRYFGHDLP